jgi:hypothetical protein
MIGGILWSLLWIAIGLILAPVVYPWIDAAMKWLKARRR